MYLKDRQKLAKLMVIQEVSQRELARHAKWKSHSYLGRLLKGTVSTLDTEPALLIAHFLGVPVDDLFLTKTDAIPVRRGQVGRPSRGRAA